MSLSRCNSPNTTAPMLYTDGTSDHPVLKDVSPKRLCWFLRDRRIDQRFLWPKALYHPMLKSLSWRVSILIQIRHQIDRWCPHLDRRIIGATVFSSPAPSNHLTQLETGRCQLQLAFCAAYQVHRCSPLEYRRFIWRWLFLVFSRRWLVSLLLWL
jgi:hypothetical protein